jgi:hypothetical protein
MNGQTLSDMSKIPPQPNTVNHPGGAAVGYTCHMAAMHWAQMALGKPQQEANRVVGEFARANCPGCRGQGPHGSILPRVYGELFCSSARLVPNRQWLFGMVAVGDVLITEHPSMPMHTMVVRRRTGPNEVTIRGFNNTGTLNTGVRDQYDPVSHNIMKDKYWRDPNAGRFGVVGVPVYVISSTTFLSQSRGLARLV